MSLFLKEMEWKKKEEKEEEKSAGEACERTHVCFHVFFSSKCRSEPVLTPLKTWKPLDREKRLPQTRIHLNFHACKIPRASIRSDVVPVFLDLYLLLWNLKDVPLRTHPLCFTPTSPFMCGTPPLFSTNNLTRFWLPIVAILKQRKRGSISSQGKSNIGPLQTRCKQRNWFFATEHRGKKSLGFKSYSLLCCFNFIIVYFYGRINTSIKCLEDNVFPECKVTFCLTKPPKKLYLHRYALPGNFISN